MKEPKDQMPEGPEDSGRVEALVELQDQIDQAQEVSPLSGAKRLVVGGWLALAAHYFMIGGVPLDGLQPALLGLAAVGGWGCAIWGGTKFVLARRKLRALTKEIPEALPPHCHTPQLSSLSNGQAGPSERRTP